MTALSIMRYYISPSPLCDWCEYCTIPQYRTRHSGPFKAISTSPSTGITFKAHKYSATQLADAFEKLIPGHMEFEIKRQALTRWNALLPEILDGPLLRDAEFDLKDSFSILDDFLLLRALRNRCRVEWVDSRTGRYQSFSGWCEPAEETNQGPTQWIRIVRPTINNPRTVLEILCILMHEMCHAIFAFRCNCFCCSCPLNNMNGEGLDCHGPSWEKLRRSVEETANLHLKGFSKSFNLCHPSEPQIKAERKAVGRMLSGLYKRLMQQGSHSAELKRDERSKRKVEVFERTEQTEVEWMESIECASDIFWKSDHDKI